MRKVLLNGTQNHTGLINLCIDALINGKPNEVCIGFQVNRDSDLESLQRDFFLANLLEIGHAVFVREKKYFLPHSFRDLHQRSIYKDSDIKAMNLAQWDKYEPEDKPEKTTTSPRVKKKSNELRAIVILEHKDSLITGETIRVQFDEFCGLARVKQIQKIFKMDLTGSTFGVHTLQEKEVGTVLLDVGDMLEIQDYNTNPKEGFFRILDSNAMIDGYGICIKK